MRKLILSAITLMSLALAKGQPAIEKESWTSQPALHTIDEQYNKESAVIVFDKRRIEYIDEGEQLMAYKTLHKIVHVNDDRGIESFNKVYLGVSDDGDIVEIHARTILPNGKVVLLDEHNIKDQKDEDGNVYKIFALDGLEKGCEVEYYYTYKRPAYFFGREVIQSGVPVIESRVEVISPERLVYDCRAYNAPGIEATSDTTLEGKRAVYITQHNIAGSEEEKYSTYTANLQRIEFKLSYNLSRSNQERLFTWNELAKRVYEIYSSCSDKEMRKVDDFVKKNKWASLGSEKEKIVAVENYLKKNIATREDVDVDEADNLEMIIKNHIASYQGTMRLYGAIFKKLDVNYQFVLAGDRNDYIIDPEFENWNNAENPLLYFPNEKQFLAPTRLEMRYPWIHPYWGGTNGLFCKGTTIGNFTTAIGEIKPIRLEDYTHTLSNIEARLSIDPATDSLLIDIKQIHSGYEAAYYRASFTFSTAEEQRQLLKDLVKFGTNSENIISSKLENTDFESYSENKPFVLEARVNASELMERAGNKILLKVGEVIGQQVEMYQEKPRQSPMDIGFPHRLERKIDLVVPEGYSVSNLDALNLNNVQKDNNQITMQFVSNYQREGNIIHIHVLEEYRALNYPIEQYEEFKKIINAAADFNKVILVLEKKTS